MFCPRCGRPIAENAEVCFQCGTALGQDTEVPPSRSGSAIRNFEPGGTAPGTARAKNSIADTHSGRRSAALERYRNGYRVAGFYCGLGYVVRLVGVVIGIIIVLLGLTSSGDMMRQFGSAGSGIAIGALISAIIVGGIIFVIGVIISGFGERLKAELDCAVHTSPFLDFDGKAEAMSL